MTIEQVLHRLFDLKTKTGDNEWLINCCFHDDNKPSLSLNTAKLLFKCHGCGVGGGIEKLISKKIGYSESVVKYELEYYAQVKDFPRFDWRTAHNLLMSSPAVLTFLEEKRKWSVEVIKKLAIGFDGQRILLPVISALGDVVNVRAYKPGAAAGEHKMLNSPGHGHGRIYGIDALKIQTGEHQPDPVVITEGEPDCIAARSIGLRSLSSTSGAGSVPTGAAELLATVSDVILLYDSDDPGIAGARKFASAINSGKVRIASIGNVLNGKGKDLTDFLNSGGSRESLDHLLILSEAVLPTRGKVERPVITDEPPIETTLQESSQEQFYHRLVKMRVMVSGKTLAPYLVPKEVEVTCPDPGLDMCAGCGLAALKCKTTLKFDHLNPATLELIETVSENHERVFKKLVGIPKRCSLSVHNIVEAQNIEEAKVIPVLEETSGESEYVMRQVFIIGHGIRANNSYEMIGLTLPHPKTQQVTYLVYQATGLEDSITTFKVSEDLITALRIFSVEDEHPETIGSNL